MNIELQWQDEPDGEGWYWVETSPVPYWLRLRPMKPGPLWHAYENHIATSGFSLAGRRVAKIPGPPK